jgi:RimJ/RimL family protein N-acetyltransferase
MFEIVRFLKDCSGTIAVEGSVVAADIAKYSARVLLRDGSSILVRALRPDDRAGLIAAVERSSTESLYRRFFRVKRNFTEKEIAHLVDVDFVNHVALVVTVEENGKPAIVGGARYVVTGPGTAEVAFTVIDTFQGRGIGLVLLRHLIAISRNAGLKELTAEVLPDNGPMLRVFESSGLRMSLDRNPYEIHVALQLF